MHRPLAGSVCLALLAATLFVYSLTGSWFAWEGEQLVKYVAGVAGLGALTAAGSYFRMWEKRRAWVAEHGLPVQS